MDKLIQRLALAIFLLFLVFSSAVVHAIDDKALFDKAVKLTTQGNWSQAANIFREIAQRNPTWPEPKNNLAVAMLHMGKIEQAQQALEEAVTSQPSFKTAQNNRKRLYEHLAAAAYDKAIGNSNKSRLPVLDLLTVLEQPTVVAEETAEAITHTDNGSGDLVNTIKQRLIGWARAWSVADIDQYFASYSTQFKPNDPRKDYNQWRNIRRARLKLSKNTEVTLHDIKIYLDQDNHQALAEFTQHYRSANYSDTVIKQLHMAFENEQWLILSERVIQQLN